MGFEGPIPVTVHVTGFKKFHGVPHNPTETIVSNLREFLKRRGGSVGGGFSLGSCTVLEASGDEIYSFLYERMELSRGGLGGPISDSSPNNNNNGQVIWLHFGTIGGLSKFTIEHQAVNEASFLCPDEQGWQPQQLPVAFEDGGTYQKRQSTCPIEVIVKHLKQKGFDVAISDDAGRFVCNYIYYHSLRFAEKKGHKSLFVHVPLFSRIEEDTQMEFVALLLESLALTN